MSVSFAYDATHVSSIAVGGVNLLTGGGVYLVGSRTGADSPSVGYTSVGSDGRFMTNGGPPFRLSFWQPSANALGFRAEVGPVDTLITTLSLPFDFDKQVIRQFAFEGSRYFLNNSPDAAEYRSGSRLDYRSTPTPFPIHKDRKFLGRKLLGYTGVAETYQPTPWGEVAGPLATVRVTVLRAEHYHSMGFFNHFGTNNLELFFKSFQPGERAAVEGELVVTPQRPATP